MDMKDPRGKEHTKSIFSEQERPRKKSHKEEWEESGWYVIFSGRELKSSPWKQS
jgi:hypothetical protein